MGGNVAFQTGLPVSGDRTVDDHGIERGYRIIVEAEPRHDARPELLDDDIRAFQQRAEPLVLGGAFQIEGDAALAAIEEGKARAVAPPIRQMAAHLFTASWRLDLDN